MKTIIKSISFFLVLIYISSCGKEESDIQVDNALSKNDSINKDITTSDTINTDIVKPVCNYVIAGDTSFNVIYYELEPNHEYDPEYENPFAIHDSIDLDGNGIFDYKFYISGANTEELGYIYFNHIYSLNKNEIVGSDFNCYPDTLSQNDTINESLKWITEGDLTFDDGFDEIETNWTGVKNKYLGIRLITTDTIYGWIKMDIERYGKYVIYDYALMKKE